MIRAAVFLVFIILNVNGYPKTNDDEHPYKLYTRKDWCAEPSTDMRPIKKPIPYVVIHHTAIPGACNTTQECMADMRSMQNYHMSLDWGDIGYHFCVGSGGEAYEGRGWDWIGIHATKANNYSLGICLIGDWRVDEPPTKMLETTQALIKHGVRRGDISPSYKLIAHKQVSSTECPGTRLFNIISTWDHFCPGPFDYNKKKV